MYPILMRLADRGLLETAWERDAPIGRPPRHLYRLTDSGLELAKELAAAEARAARAKRGRLRPQTEGA
jgi:DNA-binding PadR family transcriptional regulator